jgi:hypothetical protein
MKIWKFKLLQKFNIQGQKIEKLLLDKIKGYLITFILCETKHD